MPLNRIVASGCHRERVGTDHERLVGEERSLTGTSAQRGIGIEGVSGDGGKRSRLVVFENVLLLDERRIGAAGSQARDRRIDEVGSAQAWLRAAGGRGQRMESAGVSGVI